MPARKSTDAQTKKVVTKTATTATTATPVATSPATPVVATPATPVVATPVVAKVTPAVTKTVVATPVVSAPAASSSASSAPVTASSAAPVVVKSAKKLATPKVRSVAPVADASASASAPASAASAAPVASSDSSAPVADDESVADSKMTSDEVFQAALKDAQNLIVVARGMVARVREMKKVFDREHKESHKTTRKARKQVGTTPREPTGFAKPCYMKSALVNFLRDVAGNTDIKGDELITRTEVTKRLNAYIIKNQLRDIEDQRKILYTKDAKLAPLITLPPGVSELTYFNLQTAIKDLFEKVESKASPAASSSAVAPVVAAPVAVAAK
jgi:hypothetical protein